MSVFALAAILCGGLGCEPSATPSAGSQTGFESEAKAWEPAKGFRRLTADDFDSANGEFDISVEWIRADGEGLDRLVTLREGRGYVFTKETFGNFTLRLEYRFPNEEGITDPEELAAFNSGVFVFVQEPHKVWPSCLEVQGKWSEMGHIKSNDRDITVEVSDNEEARQQARKPVGEWNDLKIVTRDGAVTSYVNGTKVCENEPIERTSGLIGLQSEGYEVEFRRVEIRVED